MRFDLSPAYPAALLLTIACFATGKAAVADTIQLGSFGTTVTAPGGVGNTATTFGASGATYDLPSGRSWATPLGNSSWISFDANASPGGSSAPANGTYVYETSFLLTGGSVFSGTISVMADDTSDVVLNGHTLSSVGGARAGLSSAASFVLPSMYLVSGLNTLVFDVQQVHGGATGVDFGGSVTVTPEPDSLILLGTGALAVVGGWARRRRA